MTSKATWNKRIPLKPSQIKIFYLNAKRVCHLQSTSWFLSVFQSPLAAGPAVSWSSAQPAHKQPIRLKWRTSEWHPPTIKLDGHLNGKPKWLWAPCCWGTGLVHHTGKSSSGSARKPWRCLSKSTAADWSLLRKPSGAAGWVWGECEVYFGTDLRGWKRHPGGTSAGTASERQSSGGTPSGCTAASIPSDSCPCTETHVNRSETGRRWSRLA